MGGESLVPIILEGLSPFFGGSHRDSAPECFTQNSTWAVGKYDVVIVISG